MACKSVTLNSIDATCDKSVGGIRKVYIAPMSQIGDVVVYNDIVQSFDPWSSLVYTQGLIEYSFRPGTSSYTATVTRDNVNNSVSCSTELVMQFSAADKDKRNEFNKLIGIPCFVAVQDNYGKYVVLEDALLTNGVMQSGTATSDLSGFTLTLTAETFHLPYFLNETQKIEYLTSEKDRESTVLSEMKIGTNPYSITASIDESQLDLSISNTMPKEGMLLRVTVGDCVATGDWQTNNTGRLVLGYNSNDDKIKVELVNSKEKGKDTDVTFTASTVSSFNCLVVDFDYVEDVLYVVFENNY